MNIQFHWRRTATRLATLLTVAVLAACAARDDVFQDEPEGPTGGLIPARTDTVKAQTMMLSTANIFASQAGAEILGQGGSAIDAAVAVQMVLTLVEPQSSGIGGGGYMVYWNKETDKLEAYDGRETAPARADAGYFYYPDGRQMTRRQAGVSGLSVGVPGVLRMLEEAHKRHGKLPWADLFVPAIRLAENGFPVSPRLHGLIGRIYAIREDETAFRYFFDAAGEPWPVGHNLKNPKLADVYRRVAKEGADAFYNGEIAKRIVKAVNGYKDRPGKMSLEDLASYKAKVKKPVCSNYRAHWVCGVGPSTSGGVTVAMMLGILDQFDMGRLNPQDPQAAHYFIEAARLAYADREAYVADDDYDKVPLQELMATDYLKTRSDLMDDFQAQLSVGRGDPTGSETPGSVAPPVREPPSTTHFSIVDPDGNALSITTTVGWGFGSGIMVDGFVLNNQLIAFSRAKNRGDVISINGVNGGKRPRSSLAPTLVFDPSGDLRLVVGSPGGRRIPAYVAKVIVAVLDWGVDVQTAISLPNIAIGRTASELESDTSLTPFKEELERRGHRIKVRTLTSGLHAIELRDGEIRGGADPRREGIVIGK